MLLISACQAKCLATLQNIACQTLVLLLVTSRKCFELFRKHCQAMLCDLFKRQTFWSICLTSIGQMFDQMVFARFAGAFVSSEAYFPKYCVVLELMINFPLSLLRDSWRTDPSKGCSPNIRDLLAICRKFVEENGTTLLESQTSAVWQTLPRAPR